MNFKDIQLLAVVLLHLISMQCVYPWFFDTPDNIGQRYDGGIPNKAKKTIFYSDMSVADTNQLQNLRDVLEDRKPNGSRNMTKRLLQLLEKIGKVEQDLNEDEQVTLLQAVLHKRYLLKRK